MPPQNLARAVTRLQRARKLVASDDEVADEAVDRAANDKATELSRAPTNNPSAAIVAPGRRRRLWDMEPRALDMLLGVGLPHEALCRTARRVLKAEPRAHGHELHAGLVAECRRRGPLAEALQQELERRHAVAVQQSVNLKGANALSAWWQDRVGRDELPGALWAVLSHAHCTPALRQRLLGEMQMLQFQAGQAARVELARFAALIDENAVLSRLLADAQRRATAMLAEHAREREAWQIERAGWRGGLQAQAPAASAMPDREQRLADHAADQAARLPTDLSAGTALKARAPTSVSCHSELAEPAELAEPELAAVAPAPAVALDQRKVLCVGGRTASVPAYRRLVEACGGRFLHHDGGSEDKLGQLDATLAAADLVICQAGCVSHNAYWRVKDHCKRTGKRCVFVETPSAAGLQRALAKFDG